MDKKAVVITGGNGLLGKKLAMHLCKANFMVIVIDINEKSKELPDEVEYVKFDLTNIDKYDSLVAQVKSITNNLFGLVNNAAYNPKIESEQGFGNFENLDLAEWNKEITLNLSAPVFLIKAFLPVFNRENNRYCKIVNVVSTYAIVPPNQSIYKNLSEKTGIQILKPAAYPITKAGLHMLTKYLATYPGCKGINVNSIAPGGIENNQDQVFIDSYSQHVPMGRMASVDEMLASFELLLSDGSNYIQGQVITVDGGWTTW